MFKLSTFLSESGHGYSAVPLFGPADAVFEKSASASLLPEVLTYIAQLKPRPGSQYVLVNAMGAGEYYGCFPAGTLVETEDGEQNIEDVEPGTLVRTHENRLRPVLARTPKQADELCDLYAQGLPSNLPSLTATPNHELWAVTREDFLESKRKYIWGKDASIPVETRRYQAMLDLEFSWVPIASMRPGDYIAEPFPLDEDPGALGDEKWNCHEVAFLMGLYAAEGCVARRYDRDDERPASVIYVVSGEETEVVAEARRHSTTLGHSLQSIESETGTSYRLQLCFAEFARLCAEHIGTPAVDKRLSPAILRMPRGWQKTFFAAYAAGDGCVRTSVKEEATIRCVSASAALLRGMRLLVARDGLVGSISGRHNKKSTWYNGNPIYELSISGGQLKGRGTPKSYLHPDGFILSAVKRVEQYDWEGEVYDLTVEEDSSFVASGICVHNSNINGDHFEEAGLIHQPPGWTGNPLVDRALGKNWTYGFPTFYNAYPFAHHRNKDASRAYGEVELAVWHEGMKRVELVCRVDYDKCQQFGGISVWDKLKTGQFPDVSMGSKVCYDLSSITTDWEQYRKALDTFDPHKFAYPGLAVVEYHKRLKEQNGIGIRGLSITRNDYDEWTTNHMNRILPDGRKVFVYNPYPRFFDISFVFIGADRTAKTMVFIVRQGDTRYVPSVEAGEKIAHCALPEDSSSELAKVASVPYDLLKSAFGFKGAELKQGEIEKELPADTAVPLLSESDKDLPEWAIKALSSVPAEKALGTTGAMGIVLKPQEFQRITLIRLGKKDQSDQLAAANKVFPCVEETQPMSLGTEDFLPALARLLLPLLADRSALGPYIERRVIFSTRNGDEPPTSHSTEELRKIGSAYNGYRQALMDMVATAQDFLPLASPADVELAKLAAAPVEQVFTPLSFEYLQSAFLPPFAEAREGVVQHTTTSVASV